IGARADCEEAFTERARSIHRMARHNDDVVKWVEGFFFHGMPLRELGIAPGFSAKMRPVIRRDIAHVIRFLKALLPDAIRHQQDGSALRLKLTTAKRWPTLVKQQRGGVPESEFFGDVEKAAGLPPATTASVEKARLDAFS